ncbi:MAG TPA: YccF domain-containing protein [Alphaproteobacteria bacterium]|nr:YccF domain-containing protein [Alphaproteobacteria bacterium]
MTLLLNLLWFIFGGFWMGLAWLLAGLVMIVTIIGIPWAGAAFTIAGFSFWPFGRTAVDRRAITGREDIGTGPLGLIGNIVWFVIAGWWLALGHLATAVALAVTVIGIPFAWQHIKLAILAIAPIGKEIVPVRPWGF